LQRLERDDAVGIPEPANCGREPAIVCTDVHHTVHSVVLEQFDRARQRVVQWEANNVNPEAVDQVSQFVL
jgi:hypothetical protein